MTALHQLSLHALSLLIARREIRALDLTDTLIARADVAPEVFVLPTFERARVVALDALTAARDRVTLMPTLATDRALSDGPHAALLATVRRVTRIDDCPGFIAQGVLATIVNIGCEIAQMGIVAPGDIDDGVRLGLGYPEGPLALANWTRSPRSAITPAWWSATTVRSSSRTPACSGRMSAASSATTSHPSSRWKTVSWRASTAGSATNASTSTSWPGCAMPAI